MKSLQILSLTLLLALAQTAGLSSLLNAEGSGDWQAQIMKAQGEVYVRPQDHPDQYYPAQEGAPLQAGDQIQTGSDGSCELMLEEGNLIHVNPHTQFTLASLRKEDSSFELSFGSLLAKLTGLAPYHSKVQIKTPTAVAAVRGTEFGAEAGDEETHFGVFDEGKVEVTRAGENRSVMLTPNREVNVRRGQALPQPGELRIFQEYRGRMDAVRTRHQALKGTWRRLDPSASSRSRSRMLAQRAVRREAMEGKIRALRGQNRDRMRQLRTQWRLAPEKRKIVQERKREQRRKAKKEEPRKRLKEHERPAERRAR